MALIVLRNNRMTVVARIEGPIGDDLSFLSVEAQSCKNHYLYVYEQLTLRALMSTAVDIMCFY